MSDVRMRGFASKISVEAALTRLRAALEPPDVSADAEDIPAAEAVGRVLARDLASLRDVPAFERAAMDGYALRGEDTFGAGPTNPVELEVTGTVLAGRLPETELDPGQAMRIMTGAPIPKGADAVLPAKETESDGESRIRALAAVSPRRHVSRRGEDLKRGDPLLPTGRRLRPQDAAAAAGAGHARLPVLRRPRVAVLITGDELVPYDGPAPRAGQVVDVNSLLLPPLIARDGGELVRRLAVPDTREDVRAALEEAAAEAEILIVSGASSVGSEDHVPVVVAEEGEILFHGVALRPAGPAGLGLFRDRPVFLLPGNPVSCLCGYDFFAGVCLRRRAGLPEAWPYTAVRRPLAPGAKIASRLGRTDYVRVLETPDGIEPVAVSGASILSSAVRAAGFVVVPGPTEGHGEGEEVTVHLYDPVPGEGP